MRKILVILLSLVLLSSCAQSTALIGPAITIGNTGNIMQAGFSYGSNMVIKQTTGQTPGGHVATYIEEKRKRELNQLVREVNIHHCTRSCRKYNKNKAKKAIMEKLAK